MNPPDDMTRLALLAPAGGRTDPGTEPRLAALRALVDERRDTPAALGSLIPGKSTTGTRDRAPWRRRGLLLGVAAAAAVVIPVVGGILAPVSPLGLLGTPAAVAEDGRLECGSGYAQPVEPSTVEPRYLPSALPEGWSYVSVFARDETARGWCVPPSLTVLETGVDDRVNAAFKVYGPFDVRLDDSGMGTASDSTVAGHEARLFVHEDQEDEGVLFYRWFFTDDAGLTWLAEVEGYTLEQATTVVDGLITTGDRVTWAGPPASGLEIVHERTGEPYTLDSHRQAWYVNVTDGRHVFNLSVEQSLDNHAVPIFAEATVGARLTTVDGYEVVQDAVPGGTEDRDADGRGDPPLASVSVQLAPDVRARIALPTTELGTELLTSLELAPRDDERIEEYGRL